MEEDQKKFAEHLMKLAENLPVGFHSIKEEMEKISDFQKRMLDAIVVLSKMYIEQNKILNVVLHGQINSNLKNHDMLIEEFVKALVPQVKDSEELANKFVKKISAAPPDNCEACKA